MPCFCARRTASDTSVTFKSSPNAHHSWSRRSVVRVQRMAERSCPADTCLSRMLRDALMAGLAMLRCSTGHVGERRLWADLTGPVVLQLQNKVFKGMVSLGSDRPCEDCWGDCRQAATRNAKGWSMVVRTAFNSMGARSQPRYRLLHKMIRCILDQGIDVGLRLNVFKWACDEVTAG